MNGNELIAKLAQLRTEVQAVRSELDTVKQRRLAPVFLGKIVRLDTKRDRVLPEQAVSTVTGT